MAIIKPSELPANATPVTTDVLVTEGATVGKSTIAQVMTAGRPFATQLEAETGTGTTQTMNPLTTKQSIASEVGVTVQAHDDDLDAIAALAKTDGNFIVGNGTDWTAESGATARASLGLTIGTNVQAYSANLDEYAAVNPTAAGLALLDDASAADQRTTLELGTAATTNTDAYATAAQGALADTSIQPADPKLVPTGGTTGQVLAKTSDTDYDVEWADAASALVGASAGRYQVDANKVLRDPTGQVFIARGAQMFAYLFVQHEYRTDYRYRTSQGTLTLADSSVVTTGAGTGISEPTYYSRFLGYHYDAGTDTLTKPLTWDEFIDEQLDYAAAVGMNLVQVSVEPAMRYTPSYIHHIDGLTYPAEMDMLDYIIDGCVSRNMRVMLRPTNDQPSIAIRADFLSWLGTRYKDNPHVWLHTANEINCFGVRQSDGSLIPNTNCTVPAAWAADQIDLLTAIRASGFLNPVVINSTGYGGDISEVLSELLASTVFTADPNLIIGTHNYKRDADTNFITARWAETETEWAAGLSGGWCCIVDEVGSTNVDGRIDPALEPDDPQTDPTEWTHTQSYMRQFLRWCTAACADGRLYGVIAFNWGTFLPNLGNIHDKNSLRKVGTDNGWSGWGDLFRVHFLHKAIERIGPAQCRLVKATSGISLIPFNGNKVPISGRMWTLPKDGINFDTSTLTADTLYYVYARIVSGAIELQASTTGYITDYFRDIPVKSDNVDATLVGMVYRDATVGAVDQATARLVRSWFNSPPIRMSDSFTADRTSTSASLDLINAEMNIKFLAWEGEVLEASYVGSVTNTSAAAVNTALNLDGTSLSPTTIATAWDTTEKQIPIHAHSMTDIASTGLHTLTAYGSRGAGTATWKSGGRIHAVIA